MKEIIAAKKLTFRQMDSVSAKVVLLGESAVGKTAISTRFVADVFDPQYKNTVGASFLSKSITVNNTQYDLAIWDTAGQEVYRTLTPMYYRDANMALIVFDLTNRDTFLKVKGWVDELHENTEKVAIVICGNKSDIEEERAVETNEALKLAEELGVDYIETSAKNNSGIQEAFEAVINAFDEDEIPSPEQVPAPVSITQDSAPAKKKCC